MSSGPAYARPSSLAAKLSLQTCVPTGLPRAIARLRTTQSVRRLSAGPRHAGSRIPQAKPPLDPCFSRFTLVEKPD